MKAPELEEIFEITATLNPHYMEGGRLMAMINGGDVTGKIKGKVLPVGGEFGIFISADTYKIDVRAAIQAEDGSIIYLSYGGFMHADPAKLKMLFSHDGKDLDPSEYYWRTNPIFETAARDSPESLPISLRLRFSKRLSPRIRQTSPNRIANRWGFLKSW